MIVRPCPSEIQELVEHTGFECSLHVLGSEVGVGKQQLEPKLKRREEFYPLGQLPNSSSFDFTQKDGEIEIDTVMSY